MNDRPELGPASMAMVRNILKLRKARRWTAADLAGRLAEVGCVMGRYTIANLETGRRTTITVDELAAIALVFKVEPWSMMGDTPLCIVCQNNVPVGFSCNSCGQGTKEGH